MSKYTKLQKPKKSYDLIPERDVESMLNFHRVSQERMPAAEKVYAGSSMLQFHQVAMRDAGEKVAMSNTKRVLMDLSA